MLIWDPQVGDLAAQVFHTELFQHAGLAIWNSSWYAGHYTLNYSLLFPPAAALVGPQVVGMLSVVASSYLFDRLVRDHWGAEARWATLWFAAGVVTLLADGQLTFAFGVAFGLASLRSLQTGEDDARDSPRPPPARWRARSPGAFLAGRPRRRDLGTRQAPQPHRDRRRRARLRPHRRAEPRLPRTGPLPLRHLLLHLDPDLVRGRALPHLARRRRGATAARGHRLRRRRDRDLPHPERARRQRGAPRRPLRRPGAGRGPALPPAAAARPAAR